MADFLLMLPYAADDAAASPLAAEAGCHLTRHCLFMLPRRLLRACAMRMLVLSAIRFLR